ncbi:hypothetical protein cypCar_00012026 [Cyprinus carpio]|nr:hypothetical protein cypCar_00012026 [Cyprinus carpio]
MDESETEKFAGQDVVFQCLGESLLHNAFQGYNACIFAYGQTGSGKSYTMMGSADQPGLIPRLCSSLFERTIQHQREEESFTVEVSYMEIYNEKVRDLLDPKGSRQALRVREHKVLGPYVDGLSRLAVESYKDIESLMSEGNKSRTVAATNMNEESSRSHAVFNIILTHTLKDLQSGDSLGGNSRTAMVATVSPAADNYDETLSTLRYADRAKSIVNHAVVNEDPNARIIRELREEVEKLRDQLTQAESMKAPELKERLEESEKLIQEMTVTWEEKLRKTEEIAQERQKQLESLGISLQSSGIKVGEDKCFLVNLNADPALNELLVYYLKEHTKVGSADSQDIQLCGMGIQAEHCVINITPEGAVFLNPYRNSRTCVNGSPVTSRQQLHHGDRIFWGNNHFFRINLPKRRLRGEEEEGEGGNMKNSNSSEQLDGEGDTASEVSSEVSFSYEFAQTEVMMKALGSNGNLPQVLKRDAVLSEPAIQVRRKGKGKQIWALEKMENRLVDMRELYQEWKDFDEDNPVMRSYFKRADPFFDEQVNHSLIGVANVFLSCLFYDVKLQYAVPIINQKGEVAGRLHVEVMRMGGGFDDSVAGGDDSDGSPDGDVQERKLVCMIKILQATGLPQYLSNFVFCQYSFWDQAEPIIVAPEVDPSASFSSSKDPHCMVVFDSCKENAVTVTEDFIEYLTEGAVAIEVYGHRQADPGRNPALWDLSIIQAKTRTLRDRWSEVTRKLEMWVQILELNENGEYMPVEVVPARDVRTSGIFQLKQGQSRRIQVEVRSVQDSGTMPLIAEIILGVSIGCVEIRQVQMTKNNEPQELEGDEMDSYQEVAVKEHLAGKGKGSRRSLSSPSVHRLSGSRQDLSLNSVLDDNKNRWESQQDIFGTSSQFSKTLPRPSRPPTPPTQNQDPEQVKALVPQMPKLLKSLFPVRDDKKDLRPSPHSQQHVPRIMMQTANNADEGRVRIEPVAVLGKSPASDRHSDGPDAPSSVHDPHDLPLSPISESSSGYFSTSVSTATLSDVSIACGDLTPTPNSQAGPVASRLDNEDCLPTPVNASVAPVEAGLRSDRPRKEEDTQAAHRNGVTTSQQEAQLNATPPLVLGTSTDSPFSLQKVKANELRSFSNILGDGKATTMQTDSLEKLEITFEDVEPKELAWLKVGGRVTVGSNKSGTVRYIGPTHFSEGIWVGIELDTPSGKNDGSVEGHQYFRCNPGYGVLVRPDRLTRREASKRHTENRRSGEFSQQLRGGAGTAIQKGENRKSWTS